MVSARSKQNGTVLYDLEDHVELNDADFKLVGDGDIERISSILGQSRSPNLLYVGKSGLGKTANIHGIAQRKKATIEGTLAADESRLPLHMIDRRYMVLDTNRLFSRNDPERIQQKLKEIFAELDKPGRHVLIIEDMNDWLRGIEDNQCQGMIPSFINQLNRGAFQLIAMVRDEAGKNNLASVLEAHSEMTELFTVLEKKPPSKDEVLEIMRRSKGALEGHHDGLHITDEANEEIVNLTFLYPNLRQYMREQPARSLRMRDQIASTFVSRMQARPQELTELERELKSVSDNIANSGETDELIAARETIEAQIQQVQETWDTRTHELGQAYLKKRTLERDLQELEGDIDEEKEALKADFEEEYGREFTDKDYAAHKTSKIKGLETFSRQARKELESADEAAQAIKSAHNTQLTLSVQDIRDGFSEMTGIPVKDLNADEATKVMGLDSRLKEKIYGQDDVVDTISGAIRRAKAGLKDPQKPIGSFMMLGSSGVGKSYMAECLAEDMYGDKEALTVFDMSEFMERQNLSRLIGSTPGLVGYGEGGKLTNAVRSRPYQIILLDEIEKAHPDVFKILLQVLDKGRLSDELGTVDFRNTVIMMTTNLGQELSFDADRTSRNSRDDIISSVRKIFPQELINRVDDFMLFKALSPENVGRIVQREMTSLNAMLAGKKMDVVLPDADIASLVGDKYREEEGARQILKFINNNMTDQVADIVLTNSQDKQGGTIVVRYNPDNDRFDVSFTADKPDKAKQEMDAENASPAGGGGGGLVGGMPGGITRAAFSAALAPSFH